MMTGQEKGEQARRGLQPLLETKERQRKHRANLPIEEKLAILVEMQKTARATAIATGREPKPVWE